MSQLLHRITAAILLCVLIAVPADARAVTPGGLITGHWAEKTILRALEDGLIIGDDNGVDPDAPVTGAEMITILCRVFSAGKPADISAITDIGEDDWYYEAAAEAAAMGIVAPVNGRLRLEDHVTRGKAFDALAEAFQLVGAKQDAGPLEQFTDKAALTGRYKPAAAALTGPGYVRGDGSALHIDMEISLAEFLTILYRIIPNYNRAESAADEIEGGTMLSCGAGEGDTDGAGEIHITGKKFTDSVYFSCETSVVKLQEVEAPRVVLRSDSLRSLSLFATRIDRLVFASSGGDLSFSPLFGSSVHTVVVGDGGGKITLGGGVEAAEITGDGRNVVVSGSIGSLLVSGSGCTVTVSGGADVGTLSVLGAGAGTTVTVNGSCGEMTIYGEKTAVGGTGGVEKLVDHTKNSAVTLSAAESSAGKVYGLGGVTLSMTAPESLPSYLTLNASVSVSAPYGLKPCLGVWYLDDTVLSKTPVEPGTTALELSYPYKNTGEIPITATLSFALFFEDGDGGYTEKWAHRDIVLENETKFDITEVMSLVKTGYQGNYTLEWALSNDYDPLLKTAWINYKGYSSRTEYIVWISLAYQRVNIFTGSAGSWTLDRTFLVGTGAEGTGTPVGVYRVFGRSSAGWTTPLYTVKPVVNFYSGYAFHSRLYYPKTTEIQDPSIGFPISHGCIRMYDEDIAWIYDNIPYNTTVVVF